ncbi:nickel-dependent hydrogenase large subunit [Thioalkalicoccus limnaeus]|uniref:Nickel-dependent hydrogenase large subunit n=1 Tax=Thioalkalicoccus limnaeus TaxID=120681 RepID=A0ABV4BIS2_9GAMM
MRQPSSVGAFVGREAVEMAALVPALFRLCAAAQAAACAAALEQARGRSAPSSERRARARRVAAETVREHLWRILLDWPLALGEAPQVSAMAEVIALHDRWRQEPASHPVGARSAAEVALGRHVAEWVFGRAPRAWVAEIGDRAALTYWSEHTGTPAARLCRVLLATGRGGFGRCAVPPLPDCAGGALATVLGGPEAAAFIAAPTWAGRPHETSPLTRRADHPLIRDLDLAFGNGLVTRLAAQLVELADLIEPAASDVAGRFDAVSPDSAMGTGIGLVPAARGLLAHWVRLDGDRIADYRILAPTDWNGHPDGVLASGLAALIDAAGPSADAWARLFVAAVDPCVACELAYDAAGD